MKNIQYLNFWNVLDKIACQQLIADATALIQATFVGYLPSGENNDIKWLLHWWYYSDDIFLKVRNRQLFSELVLSAYWILFRFVFFFGGPYLAVPRACSWLCVLGSVLMGLGDYVGCSVFPMQAIILLAVLSLLLPLIKLKKWSMKFEM